ncbi:MAG: PAS domain-containing sensor histidine kinase [Chthoniobacteraceae bacterium]|nr:PAS domain-containing sensor histidine kinase [Chthoniobacteraceae bacterium]
MALSPQEKEERLRAVLEAVPNGILGTDTEGLITLCNAEAERMFGYAPGELVGQSVEVLVPPRFQGTHPVLHAQFVEHPVKRQMGAGRDLTGVRKDGSEFPVEIGLNPLHTAHGLIVVASVVDITERKLIEARLHEAYEVGRRRTREMERLIYTVSHDLRSPLEAAMGFAELLREEVGPAELPEAAEALDGLGRAHEQLRLLIQDLLELSRAGGMALKPERVELSSLLEEIVRTLAPVAAARGTRIEVAEGFPAVLADPARLRQVFQNLLANALKYGTGAREPRIRVFWRETTEEFRFCVADNGEGIPPEAHRRIFEVFQRLSSSQEGTGIGLAIVARIAALHGGQAWVESTPGAGAEFWVSLPKGALGVRGS